MGTKRTTRSASKGYRIGRSSVHAKGLFATRTIKKGERVAEYLGERISHAEAERRHAKKSDDDAHTFLFTVDDSVVIDAGVRGSPARFINHSCSPNAESVVEDGRVFIDAIRTIRRGEEIAYDYNITRDPDDAPDADQVFACRCGSKACRGSMLEPKKKLKRAKKSGQKKKGSTKRAVTRRGSKRGSAKRGNSRSARRLGATG